MEHQQIIPKTITFVKDTLKNAEGGHDWFHIERVYKNALLIAKNENANMLVIQLAALLHDIADSKFHNGDETIGPKVAINFLSKEKVPKQIITQVVKIIENISYKGGHIVSSFKSKELDIVQDADRLDAIGAIGIARCFNYGGFKERALYDPSIPANLSMTKEEYKNSTAPSINHFYEKLLLLKDKMNTKTGRDLANKRHEFMKLYLEQFYLEWEGKV